MKKIFTLILITLFVIVGCSKSYLKNLSFNELKEKMENKESFVVYFTGKDNSLENHLSSIAEEYNLTFYKVNSSKISEQEKLDFQKIITFEEPSIVFILNGSDPSKLSHVSDTSTTKKHIIERLKDMNFIQK